MRRRKDGLIGNFVVAFASQGIALIASVVMSVLVPKYLSVEQFGYWQLFIFYGGYVGFFLFGLNGGIYLEYGGSSRSTIDRSAVGQQILIGIWSQVLISAVIMAVLAGNSLADERSFVVFATAILLTISNVNDLFGYTFQAINETRIYSKATIIDKTSFLLLIIILNIIFRINSFEPYVVGYLLCRSAATVYSVLHGLDFLQVGKFSFRTGVERAISSVRVGIKLMLSSIATMLILGVARYTVDRVWGIEVFSQFSLAISLDNFFLLFVTQVSIVLFPALRRIDKDRQLAVFVVLRDGLDLVSPFAYVLCFPISCLVAWWLPQYAAAVNYFALMVPICVFDCKMNMVGATYLKVLRQEKALLVINVVAACTSAIGVLYFSYVVGSIEGVITTIAIVVVLRSIFTDIYVSNCLGVEQSRVKYQVLLLSCAHLLICSTELTATGCLIMSLLYATFLLVNRKTLSSALKLVREKRMLRQ